MKPLRPLLLLAGFAIGLLGSSVAQAGGHTTMICTTKNPDGSWTDCTVFEDTYDCGHTDLRGCGGDDGCACYDMDTKNPDRISKKNKKKEKPREGELGR